MYVQIRFGSRLVRRISFTLPAAWMRRSDIGPLVWVILSFVYLLMLQYLILNEISLRNK